MSHGNTEIDSFFLRQGPHAVPGHCWLNYLLQTREYIPRVSAAGGGAVPSEVSKSGA